MSADDESVDYVGCRIGSWIFLNCLSLDLGFVPLVPLSNCLYKVGILELLLLPIISTISVCSLHYEALKSCWLLICRWCWMPHSQGNASVRHILWLVVEAVGSAQEVWLAPCTLSQCYNNGQKPRSSSLIRKHRGAFIRGWPPCALWVSIDYFHHVTLMAFVLMRRWYAAVISAYIHFTLLVTHTLNLPPSHCHH